MQVAQTVGRTLAHKQLAKGEPTRGSNLQLYGTVGRPMAQEEQLGSANLAFTKECLPIAGDPRQDLQ